MAVLAQLVAESARFVSYPYPLHILRLETILTAAAASGVLLTLHVANRYAPTRRRTLLIAAIAMMTLVTLLVPGFDGKTALVIVSALVVVIVAAAFGIRALCKRHLEVMGLRRDREFSLLVEGLSPRGRLPPGGLHTLLENALTHNSYPRGAVFRLERDTAPGGRIVYRLRSPSTRRARRADAARATSTCARVSRKRSTTIGRSRRDRSATNGSTRSRCRRRFDGRRACARADYRCTS